MYQSKYHSKKHFAFGLQFDSKKEAHRYQQLKILEAEGKIQALKMQVKFPLIPIQKDLNGKVIERAVSYVADFTYFTADGIYVVEDVKGIRTPEYIIKRKLMLHEHGIRIKEV